MKKIALILIIITTLIIINCTKSFEPFEENCNCNSDGNNFNFIFKYGVGAKNILNTFDCTYSKDLVLDPPTNTCLKLTNIELDSIYNKMNQIEFYNYPDTFTIDVTSDTIGIMVPASTFYFYLKIDNNEKVLYWKDEILNQNDAADKLRELILMIIDFVKSKDEYKDLPPSKGGYS